MKIVKSLKGAGLLIKGASETITDESKEQKGGFLDMLLGTLGAKYFGRERINKKCWWSHLRRWRSD